MEKIKIFLGGTCASSPWRKELISKLDTDRIKTFNPDVPNWTPECQKIEDYHRQHDDICLYVITPEAQGFYSFVEVTDDSNKRPSSTALCVLIDYNGKKFEGHNYKCVVKTADLVAKNGVFVTDNLDQLAAYLNSFIPENPKVFTL